MTPELFAEIKKVRADYDALIEQRIIDVDLPDEQKKMQTVDFVNEEKRLDELCVSLKIKAGINCIDGVATICNVCFNIFGSADRLYFYHCEEHIGINHVIFNQEDYYAY